VCTSVGSWAASRCPTAQLRSKGRLLAETNWEASLSSAGDQEVLQQACTAGVRPAWPFLLYPNQNRKQ